MQEHPVSTDRTKGGQDHLENAEAFLAQHKQLIDQRQASRDIEISLEKHVQHYRNYLLDQNTLKEKCRAIEEQKYFLDLQIVKLEQQVESHNMQIEDQRIL